MRARVFSINLTLIVVLLFGSGLTFGQEISSSEVISLEGVWRVELDIDSNEATANIVKGRDRVEGAIKLPGSLAERGFGAETEGSDFGVLTPEFKFIGVASYSRDIVVPKNWRGKSVEIELERVLWQSKVYIDGEEKSSQDGIGTSHIHTIGELTPGVHKIVVEVDNRMIHNIGDKGHAYGSYTQSIWNGITGKMEMRAYDATRVLWVKTFSDLDRGVVDLKIDVEADRGSKATIKYTISDAVTGQEVIGGTFQSKLIRGVNSINIPVEVEGKLKRWSEFRPSTYTLKTELFAGRAYDWNSTEFGYLSIAHNGTKLLINGEPVMLRGNLDCVHFPVTGYASCSVADWTKIFKIYKDYGLNHARFHSWCPPQAAFTAANRVGIYLQAEASIWIDWWMSEDMKKRGRPEMDTKGYPKGLGLDPERDKFVIDEMFRMIDRYGNNPSFTMFCIGNELGNSDFDVTKEWVRDLKSSDPRRLYSVSTARKVTDVDDYMATHYVQGVGGTRGLKGARTDWDFEEIYSQMSIPTIAHEIGQWPVYPRWSEIDKYIGVLKARNLEEMRAVAIENGIVWQTDKFVEASGALNQIMYKSEIESFLRTESCAGIQLLSLQDYQGQGEALIGWLDCHWESKGITTPKEFKRFHNYGVPLLRFEKYVWTSDEKFSSEAQLSYHGESALTGRVSWKASLSSGELLDRGVFDIDKFEVGTVTNLGDIEFALSGIEEATEIDIEISVEGTDYINSWQVWCYPSRGETMDILAVDSDSDGAVNGSTIDDLNICYVADADMFKMLDEGKKVLLIANRLGDEVTSTAINFSPLYWSLTFFPGQGKNIIGMTIENNHPALDDFPTENHSNWQWETICKDSKAFILNDMPERYSSIVQPVDDFHRNNKLGALFELAYGSGKLMVCGFDIESNKPVAKELKRSVVNYMNSTQFRPSQQISRESLGSMFPYIAEAEEVQVPDKFKGAILYVKAGGAVEEDNIDKSWTASLDKVIVEKESSYTPTVDGVWRDSEGAAWHGKDQELTIELPEGMLGSLYVHYHDWNKKGRTGELEFEGRRVSLGDHSGSGKWVKFHIMREDSNDGKVTLKSKTKRGGNLMITEFVVVSE